MSTEPCPGCGARLRMPAGFRRGRCPACRAMVTTAPAAGRRSRHNPIVANAAKVGATVRAYQAFHSAPPRRIRQLDIELPREWWLLGHAEAIEYAPPPDRSKRGGSSFRHEFGDLGGRRQRSSAALYSSGDGRWLLIPAANFKTLPSRGIVG